MPTAAWPPGPNTEATLMPPPPQPSSRPHHPTTTVSPITMPPHNHPASAMPLPPLSTSTAYGLAPLLPADPAPPPPPPRTHVLPSCIAPMLADPTAPLPPAALPPAPLPPTALSHSNLPPLSAALCHCCPAPQPPWRHLAQHAATSVNAPSPQPLRHFLILFFNSIFKICH